MKDINFKSNPEFSKQYYLKGEEREKIRDFFTDEILNFFIDYPIEHMECNGREILIAGGLGITKTEDIVPRIKSLGELMAIIANS